MKKLILVISIVFIMISMMFSGCKKWDEGFNTAWVGTYLSKPSTEYVAAFKLGEDGTFAFACGGGTFGLATTYSGKYNRNFNNGVSKSPLENTITEIRIVSSDDKSITISASWILPEGNKTDTYVLYRQ